MGEGLEGLRWVGVRMVHRRVIMGCILSVQGTGALQRPQTGVRTVHCKVEPTGISRLHVVVVSHQHKYFEILECCQ